MAPDQDPKVEETKDQSPALPEKHFFDGDNMFKFAEELGLEPKKEQPKPAAKPAPAATKADDEPCPDCPGGKKTTSKPAPKPEDAAPPYRVLKVGGKEIPVRDEAHMVELAQKGLDYTQKRQEDAEWERTLLEREEKLEAMRPILEKVKAGLDISRSEEKILRDGEVAAANPPEDEEEPLDPVAGAQIKQAKAKIDKLEQELAEIKQFRQRKEDEDAKVQEANLKTFMETEFKSAKTEFPFEEIVDTESGENVSEKLFAGIMAINLANDQQRKKLDRSFRIKTLPEYVKQAAREVSMFQSKGNGNGNGGGIPARLDAATLAKSHPDLHKEIGDAAVAEYLRNQAETPPAPRGRATETRLQPPGKGEIKGIDDALARALKDPGVEAELESFGRQHRA